MTRAQTAVCTAVSPMRGRPTLDIDNKTPEKLSEANLRLRHALTIKPSENGASVLAYRHPYIPGPF